MCKILVDMLGLQTPSSRFRGIGRYTEAMTLALIEEAGKDIHLLIHNGFLDAAKAIEKTFVPLLGSENLHYYNGLEGTDDDSKDISALLRELVIEYIEPDVVFCPSFFENADQASLSIGQFSNIPVVTTIHDLIPLVQKHLYLDPNPTFKKWYLKKLDDLKHSAGFLAISEFSKQEAIDHLGVEESSLCNTYEGAFGNFQKLDTCHKADLRERLGLEKDYIFYTGGGDPRKNLISIVEAFALLPEDVRANHQIVFAGKIPSEEMSKLKAKAENLGIASDCLLFLGFVSDDDLVRLYNAAALFVFPSLHEGFGLPAVEAMQCGTPLIGANKTSLTEIIGNPDALFDPHDPSDMAQKIERTLTDPDFRAGLLRFADEHVKQFSWDRSAKATLEWCKSIHREKGQTRQTMSNWPDITSHFDGLDNAFFQRFASMDIQRNWTDRQLKEVSRHLVQNRLWAEARKRTERLASQSNQQKAVEWRIEGPFDSSYSLAIVNRHLAKALKQAGIHSALHSSEGPGDFDPNPDFLARHADFNALHQATLGREASSFTVTSRNMFPPRATDMAALMNGFHNFAWEETGFPLEYTVKFNQNLQFLTVTSDHVKQILIDNGVNLPISVTGNGVDHWNDIDIGQAPDLPKASFVFLHVSSCFPRKGPDCLLEAYGCAFTSKDDVLLVIKTFDNPHNEIHAKIAAHKAGNPDYPAIHVIENDLPDQDLKALYEKGDCMVLPSRAEGFGLPIAEAVLSGLPVLTTGWSGGLDVAKAGGVRLIDFDFAYAQSHLGAHHSTWAEPRADHLAGLMRQAYENPNLFVSKDEIKAAQSSLLATFGWREVALRNSEAVHLASQKALKTDPRIGWISTFYKECGIATYSEHLLSALDMPVVCLADYGVDHQRAKGSVIECWRQGNEDDLETLYQTIRQQNLDVIVLQFNYGFFHFGILSRFLARLKADGYVVVIFLHSTSDKAADLGRRLSKLAESLSLCDRLIVHSINDLNRLKAVNIHHKATLFPHGVIPYQAPEKQEPVLKKPKHTNPHVIIGSYGFFLPQKGLLELIDSLVMLRSQGIDARLKMVNAQFPADVSKDLIDRAKDKIQQLGIDEYVEMHTDFLTDQESMNLLQGCDLIAFPYQQNGESASGAARYGIASGLPVAVTPVNIFDDIRSISWQLPGTSAEAIARGLGELIPQILNKEDAISELTARSKDWRDAHSYPVLGYRLRNMLTSLYRNNETL